MQSANIGTTNYFLRDEEYYLGSMANSICRIGIYDLTNGFPTNVTPYAYTIAEIDLGTADHHYLGYCLLGETFWPHEDGGTDEYVRWNVPAFGCELMAAYGTDLFIVGTFASYNDSYDGPEETQHLEVGIYHTDTGTWENITDVPWHANAMRDHTVAVAGSTVYVQDGAEFYSYLIPEPATLGLLVVGGLATVLLRRRRA